MVIECRIVEDYGCQCVQRFTVPSSIGLLIYQEECSIVHINECRSNGNSLQQEAASVLGFVDFLATSRGAIPAQLKKTIDGFGKDSFRRDEVTPDPVLDSKVIQLPHLGHLLCEDLQTIQRHEGVNKAKEPISRTFPLEAVVRQSPSPLGG